MTRISFGVMLGVPAVAAIALFFPVLGTGFFGDDFGLLQMAHAWVACAERAEQRDPGAHGKDAGADGKDAGNG